jgi:hypothetical protein
LVFAKNPAAATVSDSAQLSLAAPALLLYPEQPP